MSEWGDGRPPLIELLVRRHLVDKALTNQRKFDIFHPSAWGGCVRKVAYQWYDQKENFLQKNQSDIDIRIERVFDNGHSSHSRWQDYLDKAGILRGWWKCPNPCCEKVYGKEEKLGIFNPQKAPGWGCSCGNKKGLKYEEVMVCSGPEHNFEGHVDAVIDIRETEYFRPKGLNVFVCDIKTMKDELYSQLTEPKGEHVVQVHIYMWLLGLAGAVVLYENKDNQAVKEMFVPRDERLIEDVKRQSSWLLGLLNERKIPLRPADYTRSTLSCRLCEFQNICWNS